MTIPLPDYVIEAAEIALRKAWKTKLRVRVDAVLNAAFEAMERGGMVKSCLLYDNNGEWRLLKIDDPLPGEFRGIIVRFDGGK